MKDFLTQLAKKAGFDTESETAKAFFAGLPDVEVPEDIHKGIDNALISLTEAKNNYPELKSHYTKQALDSMDKEFLGLMDAFELDEPTRAEILAEKSTYKRGGVVTRKIVELERKKLGANSGKDKQEIQEQINDLQLQLKTTKETLELEKKSFDQQRLQDKINNKKNVFFSGVKTIHDELDPETRFTIIDSQIQKELQDKQAKFALDEHGNVILMRNDGTNFFGENHQQIKPSQFIEQVLAKNKQLKVTPTGQQPGATTPVTQPTNSGGNGKTDPNQTTLIDRNKQALADYETAMKNGAFA